MNTFLSEWTKLMSTKAIYWTTGLFLFFGVGFAAVYGLDVPADPLVKAWTGMDIRIIKATSVDPAAVETHLPGRGMDQSQQGPQDGGLARSGSPDQSHPFPREEGQAHLVEGLEGSAAPSEDHVDSIQLEQRVHSSAPCQ